jgi:hypothetical protein
MYHEYVNARLPSPALILIDMYGLAKTANIEWILPVHDNDLLSQLNSDCP